MKLAAQTFWTWFRGFAKRLPGGDPPEVMLDELLDQIHCFDKRIYFELSTNTASKELILTAQGDIAVFPLVEAIIDDAPPMDGWTFIALKPPMGFDFTHRNDGIVLKASELWFMPLKSDDDPARFGLLLGVPDADYVLAHQTVDTAFTILETGIGEQSCAIDLQHVAIGDLPDDPAAQGWIELPRLAEYIAWRKTKHTNLQD